MTSHLTKLEAHQIASMVNSKAVDLREVINSFDERIQKYSKDLNTHIYYEKSDLEKQFLRVEKDLSDGKTLPLAGVPVLVKDNICVKDMPLSCGSKILEGYVSPFNADVVEKLMGSGAIILGKANLDEFAMGSSNDTSAFGPVKNPWNKKYVPGGSSGGSAAGVSARFAPISIGSDTGGSIRQPASFCGVVGFKPTYGNVSRYGLVAFGSSLDQIGPITNSVYDASLVYDVIRGDKNDEFTKDSTLSKNVEQNLGFHSLFDQFKGRVGIISQLSGEGLSGDVASGLNTTIESLRSQGIDAEEASLPSLKYAISC